MPFSVIGSTDDVLTADGRTVKGRQYSWGVAEGNYSKEILGHNRGQAFLMKMCNG
jgi:hypothetical protein